MKSLTELYKIGRGPSSSHTMGPEKAAKLFMERNKSAYSFKVVLYGSLAKTGKGHGTDVVLKKTFTKPVDVVFDYENEHLPHPNTMDLFALDLNGKITDSWRVYSVGGGAIEVEGESSIDPPEVYPHHTFEQIRAYCDEQEITIPEYVVRFEGAQIREYLQTIWETMKNAIRQGLKASGVLPGGLNTERRAKTLYQQRHIDETPQTKENRLVCAYAFAVSEQNASGEVIATAPTCGACGNTPRRAQIRARYTQIFGRRHNRRAFYGRHNRQYRQNKCFDKRRGMRMPSGMRNGLLYGSGCACPTFRHGLRPNRILCRSCDGTSPRLDLRPRCGTCTNPLHRAQRGCRNACHKRRITCKLPHHIPSNLFRCGCRNHVSNGQGHQRSLSRNVGRRSCKELQPLSFAPRKTLQKEIILFH